VVVDLPFASLTVTVVPAGTAAPVATVPDNDNDGVVDAEDEEDPPPQPDNANASENGAANANRFIFFIINPLNNLLIMFVDEAGL
jgi:hypothetical protein